MKTILSRGEKMYKKVFAIILLSFLIIGAASAADFKINDGFEQWSDYVFKNDETGMDLYTWDYDDEYIQESYLQNSSDYNIVSGDNNTYNVTYNFDTEISQVTSYLTSGNIGMDHGVLEIAEVDGKKYIFMTYVEEGSPDDLKACYDELMKFNENNNIEPIADAI